MGQKNMPDFKPILEINPEHEIIKKLAGTEDSGRYRGREPPAPGTGPADRGRGAEKPQRVREAAEPGHGQGVVSRASNLFERVPLF